MQTWERHGKAWLDGRRVPAPRHRDAGPAGGSDEGPGCEAQDDPPSRVRIGSAPGRGRRSPPRFAQPPDGVTFRPEVSQSDFVSRGQALVAAGQFQEAVKVCRLGLLGRPTTVEGRVVLGQALLALKRFDEVLAEMRVALELDHTSIPAQVLKARGAAAQGRHRRRDRGAPQGAAGLRRAIRGSCSCSPRPSRRAPSAGERRATRRSASSATATPSTTRGIPRPMSSSAADDGPTSERRVHASRRRSRLPGSRAAIGSPRLAVGDKSGTVEVDPEIDGVEVPRRRRLRRAGGAAAGERSARRQVGGAARRRCSRRVPTSRATKAPQQERRPRPSISMRTPTSSRSPRRSCRAPRSKPRETARPDVGGPQRGQHAFGPARQRSRSCRRRRATKAPSAPPSAGADVCAALVARPPQPLPPAPLGSVAAALPPRSRRSPPRCRRCRSRSQPHMPPLPAPSAASFAAARARRSRSRCRRATQGPALGPRDRRRRSPRVVSPTACRRRARANRAARPGDRSGDRGAARRLARRQRRGGRAGAAERGERPERADPRGEERAAHRRAQAALEASDRDVDRDRRRRDRRRRVRRLPDPRDAPAEADRGGARARDGAREGRHLDRMELGAQRASTDIAQASPSTSRTARRSRARRALIAFEFGDGLPEAKAAVDGLAGQGGLDHDIAAAFVALAAGRPAGRQARRRRRAVVGVARPGCALRRRRGRAARGRSEGRHDLPQGSLRQGTAGRSTASALARAYAARLRVGGRARRRSTTCSPRTRISRRR